MCMLITTSKSFLAVDTDTGDGCVAHTGKGLYYGISYSEEVIFVGARNNEDCFNYLGTVENERGEILVFDYHLNHIDTLQAPFALRDLHQILWFDNKLWAICSADNMVAVYDGTAWEKWYPSDNMDTRGKDVNHFNSLFYDGQDLYVLAHNFGDSEIWHFSYPALKLLNKIRIGSQGHNIWKQDEELFTCDSQNGDVRSTGGCQVTLGGFPRGVVRNEERIFIGTSDIAERSMRSQVASRILIFDNLWNQRAEFLIEGHGQLLDLRSPGVKDFCVPGFTGRRVELSGNYDMNISIS